jgi:hypothetical protein
MTRYQQFNSNIEMSQVLKMHWIQNSTGRDREDGMSAFKNKLCLITQEI